MRFPPASRARHGAEPSTPALAVMTALTVPTRYAPGRDPLTLDTLIGHESAYTSYATLTDVAPAGVLRQGFGWCGPCAQTTAGVITRDGFTCGECLGGAR